MIKKTIGGFVRNLLIAIGIGALLLFIWQGWGEDGNISGFLLMLWDWFYAVCSGVVKAFNQATGNL